MSDLLMLSTEQMRRIEPYFPLSHGVPWVDDRRVLSGTLFVIRNGLRWLDAPVGYSPHKTIYNRFIRWSRLGVFNRIILTELAAQGGGTDLLMIDATHLKAHQGGGTDLLMIDATHLKAHRKADIHCSLAMIG